MDHKQNSAECFSIKQCDRPDWNLNDRSLKAEFGHPNKNENVGTHSSLNHEANSGFEGRDLLVAEGIAAQQKRNALSSKTKSPKHGLGEPFGPLQLQRERIQSLEDDLKVRDTVISVILKVINEGETSVDASVGPIDSSLPIMDIQDFSSVYSPKMEKIIQLLKKNGGDSVINSFLLNQINEQGDISDLNQKISEMESQLKEKEYAIRELKLELSKKSDIIEQNKEDYSKQHNKLSIDIENLNLKIQKLSSELRKKNDEHYQTLCILHETRNEMEKNFRIQFSSISDFLKNPRGNGESSLKSWLDNTLKKYKDSHENEVACYKKQVETLQSRIKEYEMIDHEHEVELIASRKAHEAHANGYKEHVDSLLKEINSIKSEYNQQIERFQTEIEHHLEEQQALKKLHCEENRKHHENFSELVNNYTDLEKTYLKCKSELDKRTEAVEEQTYSKCKSELDKKTEAVKVINEELATKTNEIEIYLKEIKKYESIVELCKKEIHDLNQQCENDRKQVTKYKTEIDSQNHNLDFFKGKAEEYASLINNLLNIANCSVEELISIVHDHQFCEQDISKMESERKSSELELNKIKDELLQLEKSHESDVAKYKNQILKLKDELVSMSSFEQRLFMELSVHLSLRDNFKLLFNQQAELEAYFLDKDHSESFFLQNSSADSHNYILLSESGNIESQEACSDSKPKSNMSIQPSSSSIADKARLREALVFELRKEMEGRRLESLHVNNKLECVMKANNDLNEHCKSLESKYEELKNFTAEKIDELEGFNNSNRMLSNKIDRLEHENEQLKSRVEAINDELSNRKADLDSITELFDCSTDDSGRKRYSFQMKTLFRNVPSSTPNVAAASAVAKFDKSKSNSQVKVIDKIIEQITYFNDIGEENERLKKEIDEIKENDYLSQVLKSEILSFQKKTQNLGERLNLLENEKKNLFKFERMVEQLSSKNKELQKSQAALQKRIIQIEEENSVLERKCNEMKIKFTLDTVHDDDKGCEMLENLILEFSKKAEEALSLKEELSVKQESINKLENELDSLRESKNNMQLNIDVLMNDLMESEEKLALLKQNRMELGLEKRMLEQKLVSLKVKYDQLLKAESERKSGMSFQYSSFSINQNQITDPNYENCKKQLLQTKSFSSGDWCDNQNVEFTVSLLINLEHEKEFLKQKMKMFEQFLHKFLESDCDKNELDSMKNKLKEMYDQLEDSYSNFSLEANNLKTSNFDQLLSKFDCLENQYKETCSALNYEKEELQKHVHDLQDQLLEMQENMKHLKMNSEKELFDKDLKIRQAELALKALQMDNSATSYGLVCKSDSKIDIRKQYQEEMKKIHELAVSKLKTVYIDQIEENNEKAKQRVRSIEEQYQTQVNKY